MAEVFNDQDITSANASVVLVVDDLYPNGVKLEQFSADSAVSSDSAQIAETRMGVDGKMAVGVTPQIIPVTITLEANSPSKRSLDTLFMAQQSNKKPYRCSLTVKLVSTGETYQYMRGVLQTATPLPALQKTLGPTTWVFHFESMEKV